MRIVIDARLLAARDIGSSVYCRSLLRALSRREDEHDYWLICQPGAGDSLGLDDRFRWVTLPEARLMDEPWEQLALPELLQQLSPDVYLGLSSVLPATKTCPQATIIHDAGVADEPGFYSTSLYRYLSTWLRAAAEQADLVFTVSHFSRARLQSAYGILASRVEVTCPAPDEMFWPRSEDEERDRVLRLYGLAGSYLVTVAAMEPNKNLTAILQAYRLAGARAGLGQPLVLAGSPGSAEAALSRQLDQLGLREDVVRTGYVPREHLPMLYSGATCFLWASLYEGFGLPPLEAMACGTPVISSNRAAMPEVLGEAAVMVDPAQPAAMASALTLLVENEQMRQRLRLAGLRRAAEFTWQRTAELTVDGLMRIARHER